MKEHVKIKCLTLWQPWATGIAAGVKTIETRPPSFRYSPCGLLGIHAGKAWDRIFNTGELQDAQALRCFPIDVIREGYYTRGKLIAIVPWGTSRVYETKGEWDADFEFHRCPSNFFEPGKVGLVLGTPRPINPIPVRGWQGLWTFKGEVEYIT